MPMLNLSGVQQKYLLYTQFNMCRYFIEKMTNEVVLPTDFLFKMFLINKMYYKVKQQ